MAKKRGAPKKIESPEVMWELFNRYKKETKENPFIVKDWVGGMGKMVLREKEKPLSLEGFNVWCFEQGIAGWIKDYFTNKNESYTEFSSICSIIKEQIRQDQIAGGMAGIYNPSITQRLNNLVEKTENKHEVTEIKITHER